jgi:RNA polymerase sigma-70 factor, ECF subfamily
MMPSSRGRAASENALSAPRTEVVRPDQWHAAIEANRDGNLLRAAVAQLSDRDRGMIYRSYYLGRTTTQIAAEFRVNGDVVKYELHHALRALRTILQCAGDGQLA